MTERRNQARGANEWAEIYGNVGLAAPTQLMNLPLDLLDPWQSEKGEAQPFDPYSPEDLQDLADNISMNGIIEPIHARPKSDGRFQIIAGHNRCAAAKLARLTVVPALVRQMDDDQAAIIMVDSNLKHRPYILPSNKARAYKLRMEKISHQGQRSATCGQVGHKLDGVKSRDILASESTDSARQIQRYLSLNYLHSSLLTLVDNSVRKQPDGQKKLPQIGLTTGVELSYLKAREQSLLVRVMEREKIKPPSMAQAQALRRASADIGLDEAGILSILRPQKKTRSSASITLQGERIASFFPPDTPPEVIEQEIYDALLAYKKCGRLSSAS